MKDREYKAHRKSFIKRYQAHIFVFGTLFFNTLNSALILVILIILGGQK